MKCKFKRMFQCHLSYFYNCLFTSMSSALIIFIQSSYRDRHIYVHNGHAQYAEKRIIYC